MNLLERLLQPLKFKYTIEYLNGEYEEVRAVWPSGAREEAIWDDIRWIHGPKVESKLSQFMAFLVSKGNIEERELPLTISIRPTIDSEFYEGMEYFAAFLVDHYEGETIDENDVVYWASRAWVALPKRRVNEDAPAEISQTINTET